MILNRIPVPRNWLYSVDPFRYACCPGYRPYSRWPPSGKVSLDRDTLVLVMELNVRPKKTCPAQALSLTMTMMTTHEMTMTMMTTHEMTITMNFIDVDDDDDP